MQVSASSINFPVTISNNGRLVIIGGINVLEGIDNAIEIGNSFKEVCDAEGLGFVFKASFDKANRTSNSSYRGPGIEKGLNMLAEIKRALNVSILTDVHEASQVSRVAEVCDVLQLPAFLARQTDLIAALAASGRPVNIKKPQFVSPHQAALIVEKFSQHGCSDVILCERGTCFGYDNLVLDILGIDIMKIATGGKPICVDVTHALQCRKPNEITSGGRRSQIMQISNAVVACGIAAVFVESHDNPELAPCDGASALPSHNIQQFVRQLSSIDKLIKGQLSMEVK